MSVYMESSVLARKGLWLVTVAIAMTIVGTACSTGSTSTDQTAREPSSGSPQVETEVTKANSVGKGVQLYAANCQVCHGDREGQGATGGAPPHNDTGHTWHHPDAQLKDWILNGKLPGATPTFGAMPAFKDALTEEQVDTILSYVRSWWTTEQRESQADISQRYQEALEKYQK